MTEEEKHDENVLAMHDTVPEPEELCQSCDEVYPVKDCHYYCESCCECYDEDDPCDFH